MNYSKPRCLAWAGMLMIGLSSAQSWAQDCEVKIGVTGPMTGGASSWGLAAKAAAEFEAAYVNESGGAADGKP